MIVHVSFPATISTFPAPSVAIDRNWWTPWDPAANVPLVWVVPTSQFVQPKPRLYWTVYVAMSVTPGSGPQATRKDSVFVHMDRAPTRDAGRVVSTIVHDSFVPGPASLLPAMSVAMVSNSYVPSPGVVNANQPKGPAGCVPYRVQGPPSRRYQRSIVSRPTPVPSEAV